MSTDCQISVNGIVTGEMPVYSTPGSAGMDLKANIAESIVLNPGERRLIPTGLKLSLPVGTVGMVCPRSGLALKHGVTVLNAPGILDADYRGEVGVILHNAGAVPFVVGPQERIAQLVVTTFVQIAINPVDELTNTERGEGGFGSTGRT